MALNLKLSNATANAAANAVLTQLAGGFLNFYDGSQPANPDVAVSTQNSYGSVALASPAGTCSNGVITWATATNGTVPSGLPGNATPTWFRATTSASAVALDGSCGNSASYDMNVGSSPWVSGGTINGSNLGTLTFPAH